MEEVVVEADLSNETPEGMFARLKFYCVDLLGLLRNPKKTAPFLSEMAAFLRRAPADLLQPCLDYTLLPFLLLLDASVQCRSREKVESKGSFGSVSAPLREHVISDSVAEGVLVCLEELLKKCRLGSANQMVLVLKKLTYGALLSPSEASEEFREGIIRCLKALLLRLEPCSTEACTCKQFPGLSTMISVSSLQSQGIAASKSHAGECLLEFLQSQNASAAVGHWLSLLLQTAENEASRGLRGSGKLRTEAFLTLRVLIVKVGSADALAFFLPGVVSRFAQALSVSKNMISGAAGNTESIDHAIRGLTELLVVVLRDEANLPCLQISSDNARGLFPNQNESSQTVLETLRQLPTKAQVPREAQVLTESHVQNESSALMPSDKFNYALSPKCELEENKNSHLSPRSFHVQRTKHWVEQTSVRVDKMLSAIFPHLCVHPAERVRQGLVDAIRGLLSYCSKTMKISKLMLLECLCVMVCDDSDAISVAAQEALEFLLLLDEKYFTTIEIAEIFNRLIESLPRVILGSEEAIAISHAQKLMVLMYYVGPELVVDHLLSSPIKVSRFLEFLGLSLSQNSQFAGSVDKLISSKSLSVGYLHSVAELKAVTLLGNDDHSIVRSAPSAASKISFFQNKNFQDCAESYYDLPHMPPWFVHVGSQKLYLALAGILRLVGLSLMSDKRNEVSLSVLIDSPLECFHALISEIRMKEYNNESWQSWYVRGGYGQLLRRASTAACILNEVMYGLSDQSLKFYAKFFQKKNITRAEKARGKQASHADNHSDEPGRRSVWTFHQGKDATGCIIHCVGSILHEYMSTEVWNLPTDQKSPLLVQNAEADDLSLHFFRDTTMLHQVIVDGIGIFSLTLGKDFVCSGFMHTSLFLLLKNLICSNNQIRTASDAVLRSLSAASGHPTVGHLVLANADYIVDSLCRQLRHLDLNPHIPDVLAAILSYIGAAHEILPLLEEPMRTVSLELEVLGRHQHPQLTIPFLKAVCEITKASRREACGLPNVAESFYIHVESKVLSLRNGGRENRMEKTSHEVFLAPGHMSSDRNDDEFRLEYWEEMLLKLNEMTRYRRIVGSIAESCLKAATPLLASGEELACLLALDIVENGICTLEKVEVAYKHEKEAKDAIENAINLCSFQDLQETMDTADEGINENRLLPAMNKIWPYLLLCIKNRTSVAVIRRCMGVLSDTVQRCGGDFFARRFQTDGSIIWKLLTTSPFQRKKPMPSKDERPILLPYRSTSVSSEDSMAEVSTLKIQAAALDMIAEISGNKRSASALEVVLKKVSGLVVGIACSSVTGLRDASLRVLSSLACIDSDLIWILLADVYYSMKNKDIPLPPASVDLAGILQLLPPPLSAKEYLYVQYGGESFGFNVDSVSVEIVFQKMQSKVFT